MSQEFTVRPFAFMRLTHDAIRAGMAEVAEQLAALEAAPSAEAAAALGGRFDEVRRCIDVHAAIEEKGFFPLLDERFDGAASGAGFLAEHETDLADQRAIGDAVAACREHPGAATVEPLAAAVRGWLERCERHLVHEEEIMMPLTQRVHETVEGRADAVGRLIDTVPAAELEGALMPYVLTRLEATKPFGPLRMFVEAVKISTGPERFAALAPLCRTHLSTDSVAKLEGCGAL